MNAEDTKKPSVNHPRRRTFLKKSSVATGAAITGMLNPLDLMAEASPSKTLIIAAPATPQSLDIEFDVSLGSIDSLGCI